MSSGIIAEQIFWRDELKGLFVDGSGLKGLRTCQPGDGEVVESQGGYRIRR